MSERLYRQLQARQRVLDEALKTVKRRLETSSGPQSRMDQLHEYNDVKDATQIVLGNLARLENVTVTELHEQFGLSYKNNDA